MNKQSGTCISNEPQSHVYDCRQFIVSGPGGPSVLYTQCLCSESKTMANDLDALFELFEGDDEAAEDKVAEYCTAPAGQADAQAVPVLLEDADDMDMLLSLADEAVTEPRKAATNSITAEKVAIPLAGSVIAARSRSPLASSVGTNQTNSNSLSKSTTVRMSQSKAFQTLQGSTSERNNHKSSSRSGQPDGATPAGTKSSSIHSSSSTGARVAKQQGVSQCQHFVEKLTGLKVINRSLRSFFPNL